MDSSHIDRITRMVGEHATRRSALGLVAGLGLGSSLAVLDEADARKKHKKHKKRKKPQSPPPPPPDDGCDARVGTAAELQAAIAQAPGCGSGYYRICLAAGTYDCATVPNDPLGMELGCTSLIGAGPTLTILKRNGVGTVVDCLYTAAMRDLTVTGGGDGGIDVIEGDLTLTNCIIRGNAGSQGAGINNFPGSLLTLNDCTITDNAASTPRHSGFGGGVLNAGTLVRSNTTISGNTADVAGTENCFDDNGGTGC
jgi:hypothetical protein